MSIANTTADAHAHAYRQNSKAKIVTQVHTNICTHKSMSYKCTWRLWPIIQTTVAVASELRCWEQVGGRFGKK